MSRPAPAESQPSGLESELRWVLDELCSELGFCQIAREIVRPRASPPVDAAALADEVFAAEGKDPLSDQKLWRQVRDKIERRIGQLLRDHSRTL
jgi:hypothetical protein